jgi:L-aspartate oxidase
MTELIETDVLILGCGIAGGTAALQLADTGLSVTIVTRSHDPEESNTLYAQGGIIYWADGDSPKLLQEDIFRAGAGHCNPDVVEILACEGPGAVKEILFERVHVPLSGK